jgi:hypothetical protein
MAYTMGEAKAATRIGVLHELGRGVRKNPAEAARWFRDGARLGDPLAMTRLARLLEEGIGVRKDAAEARSWRRKAEAAQQAGQPPSRVSNEAEPSRPASR